MADAGRVSYVRAPDGVHIAYRTLGSGPVDLIDVSGLGAFFSLDAADDQPLIRRFEEDLARFCRLIRFDPQGIGASDSLTEPPTAESWAAHALAVLDAIGSTRATVMATGLGAPVAITMADRYPDRIEALILVNGFAKVIADESYTVGVEPRAFDAIAAATDPDLSTGSDIDVMAPSLADDPDLRRWWIRESRRGATVANATLMWRFTRSVDVRDALPRLHLPVLSLHCRRSQFIPIPLPTWLAQQISGATHIELDSQDYVMWAVGGDAVVGAIEQFLTGARSSGRNVLAAILFTDIVDSTSRNAEEGNDVWLDRLARHDTIVHQQVRRCSGTEVKGTGDGVLATFPTPSLAVRCALAISADMEAIGMPIRAAVHAAEIERRDDDVFGLGVTIAARTLAQAGPGDVIVTSTVVGLLAGSSFTFDSRGRHELRGIPGSWELFAADVRS